jgi:hypothetical protein
LEEDVDSFEFKTDPSGLQNVKRLGAGLREDFSQRV